MNRHGDAQGRGDAPPALRRAVPGVPPFRLDSDDVVDGAGLRPAQVFDGFGLQGGNVSPHLAWSGFPEPTRSFAVTCFDPDAPTVCGFWHWLVLDVPAQVTSLPADAGRADGSLLPGAAFHLRNDFGTWGFCGSAVRPGSPTHRYVFTVHALDRDVLGVGRDTPAAMASAFLGSRTLARAELTAVHAN